MTFDCILITDSRRLHSNYPWSHIALALTEFQLQNDIGRLTRLIFSKLSWNHAAVRGVKKVSRQPPGYMCAARTRARVCVCEREKQREKVCVCFWERLICTTGLQTRSTQSWTDSTHDKNPPCKSTRSLSQTLFLTLTHTYAHIHTQTHAQAHLHKHAHVFECMILNRLFQTWGDPKWSTWHYNSRNARH